jgi:predicted esterase
MKAITRQIETPVSGRCLLYVPQGRGPLPLLLGFHGYGQAAEDMIEVMGLIPGGERWIRCAVQALHPFYPRPGRIGACWMTSQDRELRIRENVGYVNRVVDHLRQNEPAGRALVYYGFSQGTAMACRAAVLGEQEPDGVILHGGDIPPDLGDLDRMGRVLIARGRQDRIYKPERWRSDLARLGDANVDITRCEFDGGHEAGVHFLEAAGRFLAETPDSEDQRR